jgi:hypothetical protein
MLAITLIFSLILQQPAPPRKPEAPKELIQAAEKGDVEKILGLSQHAAFVGVDGKGRTALLAAAEKGQKAAFAQIITIISDQARKAAVRLPAEGQPAVGDLLSAVLVRKSFFNAADEKGMTPLMHAAREGWDDLVRLLIDGGATTTSLDEDGRSAADYAERAGRRALADALRLLPK